MLQNQELRYLGNSSQDHNATIVGYADSDLTNDKDDRKSVSGYIFSLNGNAMSWYHSRH